MCVTLSRPASAQSARAWDVYVGYAYLRESTEDLSLPAGWVASAAFHLNRWFAIVADAGGNYKTVPLVGSDLRVSAHSVMAGGRASAKLGSLVEFVQIVAGPLYTHG